MHHPFYSPKNLTDMELQEKLYECMQKKAYAANQGMNSLSDNISMMVAELQMEQETRMFAAEKEYNIRNNINPDEPITLGTIEEIDTTKKDSE